MNNFRTTQWLYLGADWPTLRQIAEVEDCHLTRHLLMSSPKRTLWRQLRHTDHLVEKAGRV
jgi:hypothetical protein